jgi:predicted metal-dependent phosphoesterase TrpH
VKGADLHLHSAASDGACAPAEVARRAAAAGFAAVALTDHDTMAGVAEARAAGAALGLKVITGCEFSVAAFWGEMHLLAYCLPEGDAELDAFLAAQRTHGRRMGDVRANGAGVGAAAEVEAVAGPPRWGGLRGPSPCGPRRGARYPEAFDRFRGRARHVPKRLPRWPT